MSSFPTIRPARDSNDISTTVWQGALRCSECDHEVAIAVDSLPEDMSGQAAPHEQLQEPLAPPHQQPRQEAARTEPVAVSSLRSTGSKASNFLISICRSCQVWGGGWPHTKSRSSENLWLLQNRCKAVPSLNTSFFKIPDS